MIDWIWWTGPASAAAIFAIGWGAGTFVGDLVMSDNAACLTAVATWCVLTAAVFG